MTRHTRRMIFEELSRLVIDRKREREKQIPKVSPYPQMLLFKKIVLVDIASESRLKSIAISDKTIHANTLHRCKQYGNKKCVSIPMFIQIKCKLQLHSGHINAFSSHLFGLLYGNRFKNWIIWQINRLYWRNIHFDSCDCYILINHI